MKFILLLPLILLIPFVVAQEVTLGVFSEGDTIQLKQICANCSYNNVTSVYITGQYEALLGNVEMQKTGSEYNYTFSNTSVPGKYVVSGIGDPNGNAEIWRYYFLITSSGEEVSGPQVAAYILLLLFLGSLLVAFRYFTAKIDFERWYDSILKKYEYKNTARAIIGSIGYNLMKNKFIWYYLFGLPIVLLITDITYVFGVNSMIELMKIALAIYWFGFLLVGVFFFGLLQEWVFNTIQDIKSRDYGV